MMQGQSKAAKWRGIADDAYEQSQGEGAPTSSGHIACEGNRLLYLFYRGLCQDAQMEEEAFADGNTSQKTWRMCLSRCVSSLRACGHRITNAQQLLAVNGFGQATVKPATQVLWQLYPPGELTDEDMEVLAAMDKAKQDAKDTQRKAASEKRAAQRKAAKVSSGSASKSKAAAAPLLDLGTHFAGAFTMGDLNRMSGVLHEYGSDINSDEEGEVGQGRGVGKGKGKKAAKPKAPKKPKEYRPQVGTANYAILICLYISHKEDGIRNAMLGSLLPAMQHASCTLYVDKQGHEHETKHSIMQKAEASGLSNKSLYNASQNQDMLRPGDRFYDGWSSVTKSLINRTPPLVQAWSSPKKVRLTNEGIVLAASLYKDVVARGKVQPLPGVNPDDDMMQQGAAADDDELAQGPMAVPLAVGLAATVAKASGGKATQARGRGQGRGRAATQVGAADAAVLSQVQPTQHMGAVGHGGSQYGLTPAQPRSAGGRAAAKGSGTRTTGRASRGWMSKSESDSGNYDDAEMHVDGGGQEHGAWGGAVCECDLGFMYDSDEADPYGYGLVRDDGPAAKRSRNKENDPTAMNGSQGVGQRFGHSSFGAVERGNVVPKQSPFASAHAQGQMADVVTPGQGAAQAAMARQAHNNANTSNCMGPSMAVNTSKQCAAAAGMQRLSAGQPLHAVLGGHDKLQARHSSPEVIVMLSDSDDENAPAAAPVPRSYQAGASGQLLAVAPAVLHQPASGRTYNNSAMVAQLDQELVENDDSFRQGRIGSGIFHTAPDQAHAYGEGHGSPGLGAMLAGSEQPARASGPGAAGRRSGSNAAAPLPPRASGGVQGLARQPSAGLGSLLAGGPAASGSHYSRGSGAAADRLDTLTSAGGASSDAAANAVSMGQPYRWQLPRLSDMPRNGTGATLRMPPMLPGTLFADQYEVVLLLDQREQFARRHAGHNLERVQARQVRAEQMRMQGIQVVERTLPIGDVTWVARRKQAPHLEYMLDQVLERKSCSDLVNSIHEKQRFQRQKWWLRQCGLTSVLYLIEGNPDAQKLTTAEVKAIKTIMMSNELDGLRVLRTENVNESVALLVRLTRSLERLCNAQSAAAALASYTGDAADGGLPLYSVWEGQVKRMQASAQRTVRDVWGCMLSAVPGLGPNTVEAITDKYPTPLSLYQAYRAAIQAAHAAGRDPMAAARDLLAGLPLPSRIGCVANRSRDVFNSLFAQDLQLWLA